MGMSIWACILVVYGHRVVYYVELYVTGYELNFWSGVYGTMIGKLLFWVDFWALW